MQKNANISISVFMRFCTKTQICIFCVFGFCVITFVPIKIQTCPAPQNDRMNLSFVKDNHVVSKKRPDVVVKWPFIRCYFSKVYRTRMRPPATSEAIPFEPITFQTRQAPQNDCLNLSFVKDEYTYGKKMARNDLITVI